jgi:osmoprotectant transport system substrate-binding protein
MKKLICLLLALTLTAGLLAGCAKKTETVKIGSKDFTESLIVAEIYALALEDAGYTVERKMNIAGSLVHAAITGGDIDLYPEYTGTGLLTILKMDMNSDPDVVYNTVKDAYKEQFNITWLDSTAINDRNGIAIRTQAAEQYGIYTMSDLQKYAPELRVCSQGEFEYREDGLPGLAKVYGEFNFKSIKVYDSGIKYQILENDEADVCPGYSTDAQLVNKDKFTYLEDDKGFWPPYYLAPIVRDEVLTANPEIADVLNRVSALLDTETIISLNAKVDIDRQEYDEVAKEFYDSIKGKTA